MPLSLESLLGACFHMIKEKEMPELLSRPNTISAACAKYHYKGMWGSSNDNPFVYLLNLSMPAEISWVIRWWTKASELRLCHKCTLILPNRLWGPDSYKEQFTHWLNIHVFPISWEHYQTTSILHLDKNVDKSLQNHISFTIVQHAVGVS